jgi:hypothetical protein
MYVQDDGSWICGGGDAPRSDILDGDPCWHEGPELRRRRVIVENGDGHVVGFSRCTEYYSSRQ